jgi:hypothetical protein
VTLPEFLIIGAPKCATTALADALATHPQLFVPDRKEPSFFDVNWERGLDWYAQFFAAARPGQLRGEATPDYFATPVCVDRIADTNPACKLVVVTRDPIARAHSHYWFRWNTGRERRSIDQVISDETASPEGEAAGYMIKNGMYARNLGLFRRRFDARDMLVLAFEDLVREPSRSAGECQRFLGVEVRELDLPHANPARTPYNVVIPRVVQWVAKYQGPPKQLIRAMLADTTLQKLRRRILRTFSTEQKNPPLSEATRARLAEIFAADSEHFRALTRAAS